MSKMTEQDQPESASNPADKPRPPRRLLWPILIVGLICTHVVFCVATVIIALQDRSFAIEPDWYQKGLRYEETIRQKRENDRLGWQVAIHVGAPLIGPQRNVVCTIMDRAGRPVEDATVDLVAFAHVRAKDRRSLVLLPQGHGTYVNTMAFEHPGVWEFRLAVKAGKEMCTCVLKREIEGMAE
jgi:hypothetical protein